MRIGAQLFTVLACAGMTISAAAAAATQTAPAAPVAAPAAATAVQAKTASAEKLICTEEPMIGTRFKKRTCLTPEHWADRRRQDQEFVTRAQRPGYSLCQSQANPVGGLNPC